MSILSCPVCKESLFKEEKRYFCINGHSFDIAKKGYVNLLMSNASKEKRHGDDKLMINCRSDFLNKGFYFPLAKLIANITLNGVDNEISVLDCGCGEGYYDEILCSIARKNNVKVSLFGMDISKDALSAMNKRCKDATLFLGSTFKIPVSDGSFNRVLNIFAPYDLNEVGRVLKKGGKLIKAFPLENHLIELKKIVYEDVYLNKPEKECDIYGWEITQHNLEYKLTLNSNEDILNLFKMTPYYYKTSELGQKRLENVSSLELTASFAVREYTKL